MAASFALVTGASSGLGVDFARAFAKRGYDVVLVARREERLRALAVELQALGRRVEIVVADLGRDDERERLASVVTALDVPLEILVNNAGLGLYGRFETIPWAKERAMLAIDIDAVVHLSKLLVPGMVARGKGYVLNIASTAAYQPTPLYTTYAAAKAFVLSFSAALAFELRDSGVSVTCLSPGITATEFLVVSKQTLTPFQRVTRMSSEAVVRAGVDAMFARRGSVVPGFINALTAAGTRITPRPVLARIAHLLMKSNEPQH